MPTPQILNLDEIKPQSARKPQIRDDGWSNIASGMGTSKDKRRYTTFKGNPLLPYAQLTNMYINEGLVATIIDLFADDLTREWGCIENDPDDEDGMGVITTALERLDAKSAFNTAEKWARLGGGALIIIGALDGRAPDTPLKVERIKSIEYLKVIDIGDILHSECVFNTDLTSPNYGKIDIYVIQYKVGNDVVKRRVHSTRCIPFFGRKVPSGTKGLPEINKYWGISEVQPIWPYLQDFTNAFGSISTVLAEYVIGKFKFSDLDEMLAEDGGKRFKSRMEGIELTKSTINGVFLGTEEDYLRDAVSLSGVPDVLDRFMMNIASVTHYPVTKLFGRSATGLNATGENDQKNYYDSVRARQNSEWPYVQALVNMVAAWKNVKVFTPFRWNPLFQLTEKEEADIERIKAEAFRTRAAGNQLYIKEGVVSPEDVYSLELEDELGAKDPSYFEDMSTPTNEPMTDPNMDPNVEPSVDPNAKPAPVKVPAKKGTV